MVVMVMDPWISQDTEEAVEVEGSSSFNNLGTSGSLHNNLTTTSSPDKSASLQPFFEDNFQPLPQPGFAKLPDSQEYLASLENKLAVIQKGGKKGATASSILESLNQVKESCMVKLLSNSVDEDQTQEFSSEEVKVNPILKKLAPEKQAISAEELIHLLKADQLELRNSEATAAAATTQSESEESTKENLSESNTEPDSKVDTEDQKLD